MCNTAFAEVDKCKAFQGLRWNDFVTNAVALRLLHCERGMGMMILESCICVGVVTDND